MTTPKSGSSGSGEKKLSAAGWEALVPRHVDQEHTMNPSLSAKVWADMMRRAGLSSPNEEEQRAFRLAVYVYAVLNGTSREGAYSGEITMSSGFSFPASVIPQATGKMAIRRFFRANAEEAYVALKGSAVMQRYDSYVAKAATYGVSAECAFAMADFLGECALLTPMEAEANKKLLTVGLERARRSRGGSLEEVESGRIAANLQAQGSVSEDVEGRNLW